MLGELSDRTASDLILLFVILSAGLAGVTSQRSEEVIQFRAVQMCMNMGG